MGFDFIMIVPLLTVLLQLLICLWMWGIFFVGIQCPPVSGGSTASCKFDALAAGDECTSFYSAILNWKSNTKSNLKLLWLKGLEVKIHSEYAWVHFIVFFLAMGPARASIEISYLTPDLWKVTLVHGTGWYLYLYMNISLYHVYCGGLIYECHGYSKTDASEIVGYLEKRCELYYKRFSNITILNPQELFLIIVIHRSLLSPSS